MSVEDNSLSKDFVICLFQVHFYATKKKNCMEVVRACVDNNKYVNSEMKKNDNDP